MTSIKQTETNRRNARKPRGYHNPAGDYPAGFKFQSRYLRAAPDQYGGGVRPVTTYSIIVPVPLSAEAEKPAASYEPTRSMRAV